MNYEEKRELRLQISQLLADAGLNQQTIKEMVLSEINNKVDRAVDQAINRLNAETPNGKFIETRINRLINDNYYTQGVIRSAVVDDLKNRVVKVVFQKCEVEEDG